MQDQGLDHLHSPDQAGDTTNGDEFMYEFLRMEMKRQRQQRRAMRRTKDSCVEIVDRFRETQRYKRELEEGKLTVTPEQAKAQNVNLMPHFEGVHLRDYRRTLACERFNEAAGRRTKWTLSRPAEREEIERMAREKALKQYEMVAPGAVGLTKHMQKKLEEGTKTHRPGESSPDEEKKEDCGEIPMSTDSEDRLRDLLRQIKRDMDDVARNIDILDGQLTLFARARERLDFRYRAAVGTRPEFLNDILLMTGGRPGEAYIKSIGDLSDGDA
jgi:hypothetical protein